MLLCQPGGSSIAPAGSLTRAVQNQLQQSGCTTALPRLLDAAAAALADAQPEPGLAHVPQHLSFAVAFNRESANVTRRVLSAQTGTARVLQLLVTGLTLHAWSSQADKASMSLPGLRVCIAALQYCSRCADLAPEDGPAPTFLEELMAAAYSAIHTICTAWNPAMHGFDPTALYYPEALQAASMLLMTATLCPPKQFTDTAVAISDQAGSVLCTLDFGTKSDSQAAW